MKSETPRTETMLRETRGQSFENQFRDAAALCDQLERELNAAEKNLADAQSDIAAEIKQGEIYLREIAELKERMAAMPNDRI